MTCSPLVAAHASILLRSMPAPTIARQTPFCASIRTGLIWGRVTTAVRPAASSLETHVCTPRPLRERKALMSPDVAYGGEEKVAVWRSGPGPVPSLGGGKMYCPNARKTVATRLPYVTPT